MPPSLPAWLSLTQFEPRIGSTPVPVQPTLRLRFNTALDTDQIAGAADLNALVILVRMDTDQAVDVEYVEYDAPSRTLSLRPAEALAAGAFYQVTLRKALRNVQGRSMASDRTWNFQVDAAPIGAVELLAPGDSTAHTQTPTLRWQGIEVASGSVLYDVQVDDSWSFGGTPLWETSQSVAASGASGAQELALGISLDANQAYYWRVRARTDSVTGDWTEPWAFWVGSTLQPSPSTRVSYQEDVLFRLETLRPEDGSYHLADWPTLQATFSGDLETDQEFLQVAPLWKESIDGQLGSTPPSQVSGAYTVSGATLSFVPDEAIEGNTRYTWTLEKTLVSQAGETLPEATSTYFTGEYRPLYGGVLSVRNLHGGCCEAVTTDEILFQLWKASLDVHRILIAADPTRNLAASQVTFQEVLEYAPAEVTYGMVQYAELSAAISTLNTHYFDLLGRAGKRVALGVLEYQVSVEVLSEIRAKLRELREERDAVTSNLLQNVRPQVVVKSQLWSECQRDWDLSHPGRKRF